VPNLHKKTKLFLSLILAVIFTFGGVSNVLADEFIPGMNSLEEVVRDVQLLHISEPDSQTLIRGAIDGLIKTLNDPYTVYMSPEDLKNFRGSLEGDYVGIGVQLAPGEIYPKVLNAMEYTPASEAGIESGDMIIRIDGLDISGEPLAKVVEKIRGLEGTKITLTIRREGTADFDIVLTRANISTSTVTGKILGSDIAYIRINTFGDFTKDEFDRTLDDLLDQGAAKLILDLQDNPGGLIRSVVEVSSYFIDEGDIVVSTVDRAGVREDYLAEGGAAVKGMPIVALVDGYTASAAEILAGALQDYGLAVLIGGQTFGKGTVQAVVPLDTGGALKITVARYHTPADRVIDGTGLTPDIQVQTPYLSVAIAQGYLSGAEKNTVVFDKNKSEAEINGIAVKSGQVIQRQGTNYLPLRLLFEALGFRVDWLQDESSIKITGFQTEAVIYPADGHYIINGLSYPGERAILSEKGSVYIQDSLLKLFDAGIQYENSSIIIEKTL
jgi:carboxyl-terminal processing protease